MGPLTRTDDLRLTAVADLADLASVTAAQLDTHTRSRALSEDRGLAACEEFMATLPRPRPRRHDRSPVDRRSRTRSDRASDWAAVFDQAAADTWAVISAMPDQCSDEERIRWGEALLVDTDADTDAGGALDLAPVPEPAILKAAAEVCRRLYAQRGKAEREKTQRIEQARARVRRSDDEGPVLAARERDLHAELVEPLTAEIDHVERLVVRSAFRVARMATWPGRGYERVPRALKLAATVSVDEADMAEAFATIGYAKIG